MNLFTDADFLPPAPKDIELLAYNSENDIYILLKHATRQEQIVSSKPTLLADPVAVITIQFDTILAVLPEPSSPVVEEAVNLE